MVSLETNYFRRRIRSRSSERSAGGPCCLTCTLMRTMTPASTAITMVVRMASSTSLLLIGAAADGEQCCLQQRGAMAPVYPADVE